MPDGCYSMDLLIMLSRIGGTDTGHVATGGIIEIRITVVGQNFIPAF